MPGRPIRGLVFLLLVPTLSWASPARERPVANVRPCFDAGYTSPGRMSGFEAGYGLGAAFEIEHAQAASLLFRLEWDLLTRFHPTYPLFDLQPSYRESSYLTWSVGARGYLRSGATLRPYGELALGVRMGGYDPDAQGVIGLPRIGIAWASHGGAGLHLEAGAKFTARDPESFLIVPIRFGVVFP